MTFDRTAHLKRIASKGGKALVKKYGKEHMSEIGKKGAKATHTKYRMQPVGTRGWVYVCRRTNKIMSKEFYRGI